MTVERNRLRTAGGEMAYTDVGEGPPALLLHGYPTSSFLWRRETWLLAQRMRVIAPDLLGYGESDKPADRDISEPAQAGYVGELLGQLGIEEAALVGHGLGGAVAQLLALGGTIRVPALVLLDSACFGLCPTVGVRMLQAVTPEQENQTFVEDIVRAAFDLGVSNRQHLDEEVLRSYLRPWLDDPGALFRATRAITGSDLVGREDELAGMNIASLLIWGEDDPFIPSELGERLQDLMPASTLALLPGCSHFITDDAPHTVGPLVYEYLRSRYLEESHAHWQPGGPVPVFLERPPDHVLLAISEEEN